LKINIEFKPLDKEYIDEALELVLSAYRYENEIVGYLPGFKDFESDLRASIEELFKYGTGTAALIDGKLAGFIAGFEVKELFGKCKGIYSPLYGHGAVKENRRSIYNEMYRHAAKIWVKRSCTSHAITLYAQDRETIDTWFWLGFGLRCIDAVRKTSLIDTENKGIIVKKVDINDIPALSGIHSQHILYYKKSPIFMPKKPEDPVKDLKEWLSGENHHMWAAYDDVKPMGYMRIEPGAESFISHHRNVMNITDAYVRNDKRKAGIGAAILNSVQQWMLDNSYPLCGVDYESINTLGSSFWGKYFTPYTFSVVRRIDERVL
jgi:GNAT superfamily N-acetyltransferase